MTMWGRNTNVSHLEEITWLLVFISTPILVLFYIQTAFYCECSSLNIISCVINNLNLPPLNNACFIITVWMLLQLGLALLPDYIHLIFNSYQGGIKQGTISPAGKVYSYNINGLQAWLLSIILFLILSYFGYIKPTIIYDNWGSILIIMAILAYILSIVAYIKAYIWPNDPADRKFTSSIFYNYIMGIELNPRTFGIDWKLFFNGRPGIIGWTIINLSFTATQHYEHGYVTNSMWLVNFLQFLYVGYFFYRESWYLKTLDISLDHFGWMFAFGDLVWLPAMYTLQALYLVKYPIELSPIYFLFVLILGMVGFHIFAESNNQKDKFKKYIIKSSDGKLQLKQTTDGANNNLYYKNDVYIWGEPIKFITCYYYTGDGVRYTSKLLISGWWGLARHINYTGDVIFSLAYSLACGYDNFFPYFYVIYLTFLLILRTVRDESKCSKKYGKYWKKYCDHVPYRFIPGLI